MDLKKLDNYKVDKQAHDILLILWNHRWEDDKNPKEFLKLVKSLKDNNITNKVGVSVYTLKSLNLIIKKFNFDLIQVPANIFDKRFLNQKLLQKLKQKKIRIFVRSVFVKGILINNKFITIY